MNEAHKDIVSNKKAFFSYEILETFEAGIKLLGTEVKSLRDHHGSLQEAYVTVMGYEALLINASIPPYKYGNIYNHEEKRKRKLLLHKRELESLRKATDVQGLTIIPLAIYLKKGLMKIRIGIAKGKKLHDKRQSVKEREGKRDIQRAMKEGS